MGYLISLHDNEVDWNLLGIRVVGHIDALPIPAGEYEYGDAYMVGTETPYDMYIYTRPDGKVHTEGYWFPIGKFPVPGPQGPKGDGIGQINAATTGTVQKVVYDTTFGATVKSDAAINYTDSTDGSIKNQEFPLISKLPILPGKYVSIDATSDNDAMEVKVDDAALAQDYIKISKILTTDSSPVIENGKTVWYQTTQYPTASSFAWRNPDGDCSFNKLKLEGISEPDGKHYLNIGQIYFSVKDTDMIVAKTTTDTGILPQAQLTHLKSLPAVNIRYDEKIFVRMDPVNAPDGTLNYVHIDSVQNGSGGYKATGQCFSITVSTRAWQIVNLDFTKSYTHQICITNPAANTKYYMTLINNRSASYHGDAAGLISDLSDIDTGFRPATRLHTTQGVAAALLYKNSQGYLIAKYGTDTEQMTANQISIWDGVK